MSKLFNILKFILLILICFGLTFLVVWPLWKFATGAPSIYTITILVILGLFIIISIIKLVKRHGKK